MTNADTNPGTVPFDTIINGDCLSILPTLPANSVDFVLTDPPYIASYKSRDGRTVPNDDNSAWLKPAFAEIYRVLASRHLLCELLRLATCRPLHAGVPSRRIPRRRTLCFSEALHLRQRITSATNTNARTFLRRATRK